MEKETNNFINLKSSQVASSSNERAYYNALLMKNELYDHLLEIERQVYELHDRLLEQYKVKWGITEQLKEENQMEWVRQMNIIKDSVNEIICKKMTFV